jgi:hypothetical protein
MENTLKLAARKTSAPRGYIILTLKFHKEARNWIGECQELGTSTYNRSLYELKKQLAELVCLQLDALEDVGEAQRFFKDNGIQFHREKPTIGTIEIPFNDKSDTFFTSYLQKIPAGQC